VRVVLCVGLVSLLAIVVLASVARAQVAGPSTSVVSVAEHETTAARRDPFVRPTSAMVNASAPPPVVPVPPMEGLSGLSGADVTVRGVLCAKGYSLALIQSPDNKQFVVRAGDRLRDAVVQAVVADGLVIVSDDWAAAAGDTGQIRKSLRTHLEDRQ
jgi:hypothetical protein